MPIDDRLAEAELDRLERVAWIEVDLKALASNVSPLSEVAGDAFLGGVVKADGYGHGLEASGRAAVSGGARYLIVATASEAVRSRRDGCRGHLLVLYPFPTSQAVTAADWGWRSRSAATTTMSNGSLPRSELLSTFTWRSTPRGAAIAEAPGVASAVVADSNLMLAGVHCVRRRHASDGGQRGRHPLDHLMGGPPTTLRAASTCVYVGRGRDRGAEGEPAGRRMGPSSGW